MLTQTDNSVKIGEKNGQTSEDMFIEKLQAINITSKQTSDDGESEH